MFFLKLETGFMKPFIICQFSDFWFIESQHFWSLCSLIASQHFQVLCSGVFVKTCLFLEFHAGVVSPYDPMGQQARGLTRGRGCLLLNMPTARLSSAKLHQVTCMDLYYIWGNKEVPDLLTSHLTCLGVSHHPQAVCRPFHNHILKSDWLTFQSNWNQVDFKQVILRIKYYWICQVKKHKRYAEFCLRNFVTITLQTQLYILLCALTYGCETSSYCF